MDRVAMLHALGEGDRKAVARSSEVAAAVLENSNLLPDLIAALGDGNEAVVAHASHALHSVFRAAPDLLQLHSQALVRHYQRDQWEILEQLGKILPGLKLNAESAPAVVQRAEHVLKNHKSAIAKACALQCIMDMAACMPEFEKQAESALTFAEKSDSKALQARARKLLKN